MIPDLRFVIGAVMATALLGVTLFGLAAAMHISHQSKLGPLEASRLLAYTPESRHRVFDIPAPRFDSPFANIPADPNPVPLQQPAAPAEAPVQTAAVTQPAPLAPAPPAPAAADAQPAPATEPMPSAQPANLPPAADDPDTVDERAVVDPPLAARDRSAAGREHRARHRRRRCPPPSRCRRSKRHRPRPHRSPNRQR